jgi:drug/metabolite transporter (DMT)-like permease
MTTAVFLAVLVAAALHATWSAAIKRDTDPHALTMSMAVLSGVAALPLVAFVAPLPAEAWPWMAASVAVHVVYLRVMAQSYRLGDLGLVYPLARGVAPLLTAIGGAVLLAEWPGTAGWIGILMVTLGALILTVPAWARGTGAGLQTAVGLALATACLISIYTLIDGTGTRIAGSALSWIVWLNLLCGAANLAIEAARGPGGTRLVPIFARWRLGLAGGLVSSAAYGIVLWATTQAPIAMVAALRETSIAFALVIAVLFLREGAHWSRVAGAGAIVVGAVALRLA